MTEQAIQFKPVKGKIQILEVDCTDIGSGLVVADFAYEFVDSERQCNRVNNIAREQQWTERQRYQALEEAELGGGNEAHDKCVDASYYKGIVVCADEDSGYEFGDPVYFLKAQSTFWQGLSRVSMRMCDSNGQVLVSDGTRFMRIEATSKIQTMIPEVVVPLSLIDKLTEV